MTTPRPEMTTGAFWVAAFERATKTMAQVAAALIGTGAVGVTELDWAQIGSVAATAFVLSILTSLASDRLGPAAGPSLGPVPTVTDRVLVPVPVEDVPAPIAEAPAPVDAPATPADTALSGDLATYTPTAPTGPNRATPAGV